MVRQGYTTIHEVLRDVTANNQGLLSNGFSGAFAGGATGVALRGLTVGATLVLIDGLRMVAYPLAGRRPAQLRRHLEHPLLRGRADRDPAGRRVRHLRLGRDRRRRQRHPEEVLHRAIRLHGRRRGAVQSGGGENIHASASPGAGASRASMNGFVTFEYRKQDRSASKAARARTGPTCNWDPHGGMDLRPGATERASSRIPSCRRPTCSDPVPAQRTRRPSRS